MTPSSPPRQAAGEPARGRRARKRALCADDARRIAEALVVRHAQAPRAPEQFPDAAAQARALRASIDALLRAAPPPETATLRQLELQQAQQLKAHADRFLARAGANRILARAVPLRLDDVELPRRGSARIRPREEGRPGDVGVEIAGLAVDLRVAQLDGPAERLISHYAGETDDYELYDVIDFLVCACALERAAGLALGGGGEAREREDRRALAARLAAVAFATQRNTLLPPLVVAMGGGVAAGKSTLAQRLADDLAAPRVVADRVREQLIEGVPGHAAHEANAWESLEPRFHERVYAELLRRAELALRSGRPVVLDACFPRERDRTAARALARRHGAPFRFVECRVDAATRRTRLAERERASGERGWHEIAERFDAVCEPVRELAEDEHLCVDSARAVEESASRLARRLPAWPAGAQA